MRVLQFENQAQALIHGALQARRQRAGVLGQEAAVEGEKLRDIRDRVAGKARRARGRENRSALNCVNSVRAAWDRL
jgi:hypothetical protein